VVAGSTRTTTAWSTTAVARPPHPSVAARPPPSGPVSLRTPLVLRSAVLSLPLCTNRCGRDPETGSLDLPPPGGGGSSVVLLAVAAASQWVSWCLASASGGHGALPVGSLFIFENCLPSQIVLTTYLSLVCDKRLTANPLPFRKRSFPRWALGKASVSRSVFFDKAFHPKRKWEYNRPSLTHCIYMIWRIHTKYNMHVTWHM
jgi:hypothetical protein